MRLSMTRSRLVRAAAVAVVATGAALPAFAPPAAASPPTERPCTLTASGSSSVENEHRSCISVTATLSSAPAVGKRATLDFTVHAEVARQGVRVTAELPPNLRWVTSPAGLAASTRTSKAPHARGQLQLASATRTFGAGEKVRYRGVVEAVKAGSAEVTVRAVADPTRRAEAGADTVFLTVGATAASSRFGIPTSPNGKTAAYTGAKPVSPVRPNADKRTLVKAPAVSAALAGTSCVKGTWNFTDRNGNGQPAISWRVEAWDSDATGGDDLLAASLTGFSGEYTLCFNNADAGGGSGQDVYIRFFADNGNWRVQNSVGGGVYNYVTGIVFNLADGVTQDFGWLQPGDPTHMRGAAAFWATQITWNNLPGACWDMIGPCRAVVIVWKPDSTSGTFYNLGTNTVHLLGADPDSGILVSHEVSHSIMDDVFDDAFPSAPSCNPHSITAASSAGCAWTEGFAEWVPATVFNDPHFRWANGAALNLENPTWGTPGWANGATVEGRVAGALIDLTDSNNEGTDRVGEGIGNLWTTVQRHNSRTFAEFWTHRAGDGFNVSNNALGSLHQNTIDFGFRP